MGDISQQIRQFPSESTKNQLTLIPQLISAGDPGIQVLMEFMRSRDVGELDRTNPSHQSEGIDLVMGKAYQFLYQSNSSIAQEFLKTYFPQGIVPLLSERNIDYYPLQQLLARQEFQAADLLTIQKLCELAGESAIARKWLYFTEVDNFPATDLNTLDQLWLAHSEGKFGFSVQRQIWLSLGKDFNKLWPKIGWKNDNTWTRYPKEFIWSLDAPKGHLPLSNQLRGVRVIASLFSHPTWSNQN